MSARKRLRVAQYALTAIGLLILGYCAAVWWGARLYQRKNAASFDSALQLKVPPASPPAAPPQAGGVLGKLDIPRLGLSVVVVEGVGHKELEHAAGHIPGTALPGQRGNMAIAAHRDSFFRPLAGIRRGDTMKVETLRGTFQYRVTSTEIVLPNDVSVLRPAAQDTLTLVTCYPFHYIGAAPKRFIVHAARV